jgi:Glycosyl transferase family 11
MVIITDKVGQLCNRLFEFSYLVANAIEYNYKLVNPNFEEFAEFFEATQNSDFGKYNIQTNGYFTQKYNQKLLWKIYSFLNNRGLNSSPFHEIIKIQTVAGEGGGGDSYNLNNTEFVKMAITKVVYLSGAWYDDNENFQKHADKIRAFFTPVQFYQTKVLDKINQIHKKDFTLVGVHIRKGDYIDFLDGIHYFDNKKYAQAMEQVEKLLTQTGKKVQFLICSNEKVNPIDFSGFDVNFSEDHFIVDLYCLAKCDYIIGPHSTFSRWASFYGHVPLLHIEKEKAIKSMAEFEVITQ